MPPWWEACDEPPQRRYGPLIIIIIIIIIINAVVVADLCKIQYLVQAILTATGLANTNQLKSVCSYLHYSVHSCLPGKLWV